MNEQIDFDVMVFDTYSPRDDAASRNYDDWLAAVDCPLFNSLNMVAGYYCWKVDRAKGVRAPAAICTDQPYTYFGFFGLNDESGFGTMMTDPKAEAHVPVWVSEWSSYPDTDDMAENFFFSLAKRIHNTSGPRTGNVLVVPYEYVESDSQGTAYGWASNPEAAKALASQVRFESWVVKEQLQGQYAPNGLALFYLDDPSQASKVWDITSNAVLGTLIAGPQ